ncbi:RNA polymerase III-inhibiting protein maf1 [Coemansia erecta]|uniref:RNA polymerase III-inhibiting protein maf1 n=1 Tax=Coemansia erecta TaxID=147472 RepID=A0A9W8CQR0_9FUNG|nr:RNA polymerase III-inhibiting protein maf1 [Coemansia erecta]
MKYLDIEAFTAINSHLTFPTTSGDRLVAGRIETYTCKAAGADKKLYRYLEQKYQEDLEEAKELSPQQSSITNTFSPFGPLSKSASRKTLFYLIATLNASFPDYEFSSLSPDQFTKEPSSESVIKSINTTLFNSGCPSVLRTKRMWDAVNKIIDIGNCDIYSYNPYDDSDPYEDDCPLWSFNYFFFNKTLKRIIFFTCRCISKIDENEVNSDEELMFGDLLDEPVETEFYPTSQHALKSMSIEAVEDKGRLRIWDQSISHVPLPNDTEEIIEEATRPLEGIRDAMNRPHIQKSLSNNMLEIMSWDLMELLTTENEYNQHIRRFLNIIIGDDPDTAHLELVDSYNLQEVTLRDQLLQLVQESLSRSDEFLYRISESRDRIAFTVEQKTQLKNQLAKAARQQH